MSLAQPLPHKPCKVCGTPFRSRPLTRKGRVVWTQHCGWACSQVTSHAKTRGKPLTAALVAWTARAQERYRQLVEDQFGRLSDREIAIVRMALRHAYQRRYQMRYHALRKAS